MTKIIRKLPAAYPPVETGAVQFGKESPGIYLTPENASYCATILAKLAPLCPEVTGILPMQLQSIIDLLWSSKINVAKTESLHTSLTKNVLDEAISVVQSVNLYASEHKSQKTTKEALLYQAEKIIQVLRALQEDA